MKREVRKISTLTLFNLDPEVVFHTNDVTLNSSIDLLNEFCQCNTCARLLWFFTKTSHHVGYKEDSVNEAGYSH
jgi:hypothetical protein